MIFPIGDENPRECRPLLTWTLIGLIGLFTLAYFAGPPGSGLRTIAGIAPGRASIGGGLIAPFCADGILDLALGLLFLWVFADNVEDRLGPWLFLPAFLAWTWIGLAAHLLAADPSAPFRGPAYGVSGVLGAYVTFFPRHYVKLINFFPIFFPRDWESSVWGRRRYGDPSTHYVTAPWAVAVWVGVLVVAGWFDLVQASLPAIVAAGLAGGGTAWLGKTVLRIRVADPTLPQELVPRIVRTGRTEPAADDSGQGGLPDGAAIRGTDESSTRAARPPAARPALGGGDKAAFLEVDASPAEEPDRVEPAAGGTGAAGFAVIRLTEELFDVSLLGRVVAGATGEYLGDVTRRIRVTRGVLARRLEREVAERIVADLQTHKVETAVIDLARVPPLPEAKLVAGAGCGPEGCVFDLRVGERVSLPWSRIGLVAAGQIESKRVVNTPASPSSISDAMVPVLDRVERTRIDTIVDFVVRAPLARLRLYKEDVNFRLMSEADVDAAMAGEQGFKQFVRALVENRGATPINTGVKVLDRGGRWGYLRFATERDFDDYGWWLYQILAIRRAQARSTSFLE